MGAKGLICFYSNTPVPGVKYQVQPSRRTQFIPVSDGALSKG
jgi:hypothetical protein